MSSKKDMLKDPNGNEYDETVVFHDGANVINSKFEGCNFVGRNSTVTYSSFGKYSYVSQFSIVKNSQIGRFTSISWGCSVGPEDHDFNRLTSSSVLTSTKTFTLFNHKFYNPFEKECSVGNDCWIGCNSTVLRGVKIPDGVVVGAHSLVTKSPPPYSIVVGAPARVLKFRFKKEIIDILLEMKWWNYPDSTIKSLDFAFSKENVEMEDLIKVKKYLETKNEQV